MTAGLQSLVVLTHIDRMVNSWNMIEIMQSEKFRLFMGIFAHHFGISPLDIFAMKNYFGGCRRDKSVEFWALLVLVEAAMNAIRYVTSYEDSDAQVRTLYM